MVKLLGLGVLLQIAACAVVGTRLLLLARRTREVPELAFGGAFWLLGVVGFPLSVAARAGLGGPEGSDSVLVAGLSAQNAACLGIALGTWRTFRPMSGRAAAAVLVFAVVFAVSVLGQISTGQPNAGGFYWLGLAGRSAAFVWAAAESLRYHALLRRRLPLGLVDPVVADRLRLWSITTVAICAGFAIFAGARLAGLAAGTQPFVLTCTSLVSVISGAAMWLAFFPPDAYLRRVAARAPAAAAAPATR